MKVENKIDMKKFNITGTCIPEKHYMVDTGDKIRKILGMIETGDYFIINRPRQYGKTTTLALLRRQLATMEEYLTVRLSFEGVGGQIFESENVFCKEFLDSLSTEQNITEKGYSELFYNEIEKATNFKFLSKALAEILSKIDKKVVLMIDEVDKSSNNDVFIYFLGMLRDKFLAAREGDDVTFHSVILAGVHDVKTLKLKIRPDAEKKFNSPWNVAVEFKVNMSFNPQEISTMLSEYSCATGNSMDIKAISERLYFWTSGYPFLVSKLCKIVDEDFLPARENKNWNAKDIDDAVLMLLKESNTLFDDMGKNLENNKELYHFIEAIILGNNMFPFEIMNPVVNFAFIYGLISNSANDKVIIHNKIFEEKITNYIMSKNKTANDTANGFIVDSYLKRTGKLDFDKVLLKFQEGVKEKYSNADVLKSDEFLEKDLKLLFLLFLKPIINGIGFSFKEVQTGAEKRLDIVVVFRDEKFVVELKLWRGEAAHNKGMKQLKDYMKAESVNKGYMLIMNKNRHKEFTHERKNGILCVFI